MLRGTFSRSAASSILRVTMLWPRAASSNLPRSKFELLPSSRAFAICRFGIEQESLCDAVDNALGVLRKWNIDAGRALDLAHLSQEHVEDDAIDGIVATEEQAGFHLGRGLAKAINAAFALLEAIRIPRQIIVENRGEGLLEIDAFAQAVGGDKTRAALLPISSMRCFRTSSGSSLVITCDVELRELLAAGAGRVARPGISPLRYSGKRPRVETYHEANDPESPRRPRASGHPRTFASVSPAHRRSWRSCWR